MSTNHINYRAVLSLVKIVILDHLNFLSHWLSGRLIQKWFGVEISSGLLFSGNGIVSILNKTANENNLDLAILKNAVGHTILNIESLEEEIGKLMA